MNSAEGSRIARIVRALVEPSAALADAGDRRRARVLASALLAMTAIFIPVDTTLVLTIEGYRVPWYGYVFLAATYALSRTRYLRYAAALGLAMFPIVVFAQIVTRSTDPFISLQFIVLALFVGIFLLGKRGLLVLGMANLASIALLPLAAPALVPNLGVLATPLAANAIGVVLALFATHQRDQIERERLAQASESEERLHLALEAARMGTWEWDVVADRVRQSERAANLLGLAPHEQEGGIDVLMGRVHPDDRRQVRAAIDAAVASGGQYGSEFRVALPDGTIRWMEGRGRAETDAAGRTVRMRGTRMDVTERRTAQEALSALTADLERRVASRTAELERANRALEAFSYSVSHDLRAPIRAISGFATMLEERHAAALDPDARRLLAVVLENASRAGRLIDDLLRLSRLSRQEMVRERIDMNALVREVVENVRQAEPARDVDVVVDDLPAAHGDRALLRQALENLLANAFKFTRPRARASVRVSGVSTPGAVRYTVRDDGVGFDMKYAGKLFDVFQRLHGEREFEGTGVGLAIVARIVERHGGTVTGEGRVDGGASFAFTLPAGSS